MESSPAKGLFARVRPALWFLTPVLLLLWFDRYGLKCWFMADDFAWLGLLRGVHDVHDVLAALFEPAAQGTIRPWSDRGFFLLFESVFGLNSLAFHIWVLLTLAADSVLLAWITRRTTGSAAAGLLAPIFWAANAALVTVMVWSSAYNEALCAFFLLAAMVCLIRYAETGRRAFWWWQLVIFSLGFGALEVNVVYPALAAAWVLFASPEAGVPAPRRRRVLWSLAPLVCISVVYFLVHRAVAAFPESGPYAIHLDGRVFRTLAVYWRWSLLPENWTAMGHSARRGEAVFWLLTIALVFFPLRRIARGRSTPLFFLSWFLIALSPMLPLPGHRTDYYVSIPLMGLAMLGAYGVSEAFRAAWAWRVAAAALLTAYLAVMIPVSGAACRWWLGRSRSVEALVAGVRGAFKGNPGKAIVLDGITPALFEDAISQSPFYPLGIDDVYLTPNERDRLLSEDDSGILSRIVLDSETLKNGILHRQVVVYSENGDHLRNSTEVWERRISGSSHANQRLDRLPRRVEVGNPLYAYLLGPEWFPVESSRFRWMPRRATVRIGGPESSKDRLVLQGYCPDAQLKAGVLHLSVSADGIPLGVAGIGSPENSFRRVFDVPPTLVGRDRVEIAISVDRSIRDAGGRDLGLVFGTVEFAQ